MSVKDNSWELAELSVAIKACPICSHPEGQGWVPRRCRWHSRRVHAFLTVWHIWKARRGSHRSDMWWVVKFSGPGPGGSLRFYLRWTWRTWRIYGFGQRLL